MNLLYDYAMSFVGKPYIWGGSHPSLGYDCSGFIQEILASVGEDPSGDQTAQSLYNHFSVGKGEVNRYGLGSLLWFGKSVTQITHVALGLDIYRMIEAGGGGSSTTNVEKAIQNGAFIRVRLIKSRTDLVSVIRPYYRRIGMI